MTIVDILTSSDVDLLYGSSSAIVNMTSAKPFSQIQIMGDGKSSTITPVKSETAEVIPITMMHRVSTLGWAGDTVDKIDTITGTSYVAVILAASSTGWLIPASHLSKAADVQTMFPNADIISAALRFSPSGTSRYIDAAHPLTADGTVSVELEASQELWAVLTTAGTVDGDNTTVGFNQITKTSGTHSIAVATARGWLLVCDKAVAG